MSTWSVVTNSLSAAVTPTYKSSQQDVEQVQAAVALFVFCAAACGLACVEYAFFTDPPDYTSLAFVFALMCLYSAAVYALRYTRYTRSTCYAMCLPIGVLTLGTYAAAEVAAEGKGEHHEGMIMCAAAVVAVILPPIPALVFSTVYFIAALFVMSVLDSMYGSSSAPQHFIVMLFLTACIVATCLVRHFKTKRIESQQRRLQAFLDASLQGMAVVDVSAHDGLLEPIDNESHSAGGFSHNPDSSVSDTSCVGEGLELTRHSGDRSMPFGRWAHVVLSSAVVDYSGVFAAMFGGVEAVEGKTLGDLVELTRQVGDSERSESSVRIGEVSTHSNDGSGSGSGSGSGTSERVTTIYEAVAKGESGFEFDCEIAVHRFTSEGGQRVGIVSLRDMTKHNLVAQADRAVETATCRAEFLGAITNELQTPITTIVSMAEVLLEEASRLPGTTLSCVRAVSASADTLHSIVGQLNESSELISSDEVLLRREPSRLVGFLETLVTEVAVMAGTKNLSVTYDYNKQLDTVFLLDATRLGQVLRIFTTNAVRYTETGGIGIVAKCKSETPTHTTVLFEVHDTGSGVAIEDQEEIFESFMQLGNPTAQTSGSGKFTDTGLGRGFAAKIIQAFDGSVTVQSQPGVGSTFSLTVSLERFGPPGTSYTGPQLLPSCRVAVYERVELLRVLQVSHLSGEGAEVTPLSTLAELIHYVCSAAGLPHGALCLEPLGDSEIRLLSAAVAERVSGMLACGERPTNRFVLLTTSTRASRTASCPPHHDLCEYMIVVRTPTSPLNASLVNAFVRRAGNLPAHAGLEETCVGSCKLGSEDSLSRSQSLLEASYGIMSGGGGGGGGSGSRSPVSRSPWNRRLSFSNLGDRQSPKTSRLDDTFEFMAKITEASDSNNTHDAPSLDRSAYDASRVSLSDSRVPHLQLKSLSSTGGGTLVGQHAPAPLPATLLNPLGLSLNSGVGSGDVEPPAALPVNRAIRTGRGGVGGVGSDESIGSVGGDGNSSGPERRPGGPVRERHSISTEGSGLANGQSLSRSNVVIGGQGPGQGPGSARRGLSLEPDSETDSSEEAYASNPVGPAFLLPLHPVSTETRGNTRGSQQQRALHRARCGSGNDASASANNDSYSSVLTTADESNNHRHSYTINSGSATNNASGVLSGRLSGTSSSNATWLTDFSQTPREGLPSADNSFNLTGGSVDVGGMSRIIRRANDSFVGLNGSSGSGGGGKRGGGGQRRTPAIPHVLATSVEEPGLDVLDSSDGVSVFSLGTFASLQQSGGLRADNHAHDHAHDTRSLLSHEPDSSASSCL